MLECKKKYVLLACSWLFLRIILSWLMVIRNVVLSGGYPCNI